MTYRAFSVLLFLASALADQCYWPNHNPATNYTACNAAAPYSSCCRPWEICMTNGLCFQTQGLANRISRGACTDQTFSSAACPKVCNDAVTDDSLTIFPAYDDAATNGAFCCVFPYNSTSNQCQLGTDGSTQPFSLDSFQAIYDRTTGATIPLDGSDPTASSANSSTAATTTVVATVTSKSSITPIAAGIATPLGILLIAALIACGILFSQLRRLRREQRAGVGAGTGAGAAAGASHVQHSQGGGYAMGSPVNYDYKVVPQEHQTEYNSAWTQQRMSPPPPVEAPSGAPPLVEIGEADSAPAKTTYR